METKQANEIIYNALDIAISKGLFNLEATTQIIEALKVVIKEDE
tara:strand:+ start:413 stop:544 length:132 start_codon:yes stop_codon:yes gene_type:complete